MNRQELHNRLLAEGINPDIFDVLGSDPDPWPGDIFLLRSVRSGVVGKADYWETYYSERGGHHFQKRFTSEEDACRYFYTWIGSFNSAKLPS